MQRICKSLRIKERQLHTKRRKPRKRYPALKYEVICEEPRVLRLMNGTLLRQAIPGVGLYLAKSGRVYSLTRYGLRQLYVNYWKKNTYGKRIMNGRGCGQGQSYPYVISQGVTYRMHQLMAKAWLGGIAEGEVPDHINGDIDNFSYANLRVVSREENDRCGGILKRLRRLAAEQNNPALDPLQWRQEDLLELFRRLQGCDLDTAMPKEIERYRTLVTLRHASVQLHDPSLNPDNMEPERREMILSKYRVEDPAKIIDDDFKHHREF